MPFEFAFLDWLYQFRNPVMNTISIFFDYAGAHGEIWIAFTLLLLLFRRTRRAGFAMAVALVLYMAAGHFFLKPLFARPRPCDINTSITMLVAASTCAGAGSLYRLYPAVPLCALSHRCPRRRSAGHRAGHCGLRICKLYGESQRETTNCIKFSYSFYFSCRSPLRPLRENAMPERPQTLRHCSI